MRMDKIQKNASKIEGYLRFMVILIRNIELIPIYNSENKKYIIYNEECDHG